MVIKPLEMEVSRRTRSEEKEWMDSSMRLLESSRLLHMFDHHTFHYRGKIWLPEMFVSPGEKTLAYKMPYLDH